MGHCTVYTSYVQAIWKQGPLGGNVGHYILGASKIEAGTTEWKRGTLHTRCKQDESRGH